MNRKASLCSTAEGYKMFFVRKVSLQFFKILISLEGRDREKVCRPFLRRVQVTAPNTQHKERTAGFYAGSAPCQAFCLPFYQVRDAGIQQILVARTNEMNRA